MFWIQAHPATADANRPGTQSLLLARERMFANTPPSCMPWQSYGNSACMISCFNNLAGMTARHHLACWKGGSCCRVDLCFHRRVPGRASRNSQPVVLMLYLATDPKIGEAAELLHRQVLKRLIGIRDSTASDLVLAELGRYPLQIHFWQQILRYHDRFFNFGQCTSFQSCQTGWHTF